MGTWDDFRDPLAALRRGDPGPFEAFVASAAGRLLGFFQRLGADRGEAEDLAQEVFLKLYRSSPTYEPRGTFGAYVLRVSRNAWVDRRRRQAARPATAALGDDDRQPQPASTGAQARRDDPTCALESSEDAARLRSALARLPATHSEVFELAVIQELPYAEIAELLGIPVGTVKSRVFHAVRKLRAELEEGSGA